MSVSSADEVNVQLLLRRAFSELHLLYCVSFRIWPSSESFILLYQSYLLYLPYKIFFCGVPVRKSECSLYRVSKDYGQYFRAQFQSEFSVRNVKIHMGPIRNGYCVRSSFSAMKVRRRGLTHVIITTPAVRLTANRLVTR